MTFYIKELLEHLKLLEFQLHSRECEFWLAFCIAKQISKLYADIRHLVNFNVSTSNADTYVP